jgi:hypothetical protein
MNQQIIVQEEPRGPSELVEINVPRNGMQRIPFPDVQQLRSTPQNNIIIKGIRLITPDVLTHAPINGGTTSPVAELQKMALVLYCEGWEKGHLIPLLVLNDVAMPAGTAPFRYQPTRFDNWVNVDWAKSYVQLGNGTSTANSPYNILLEVEYIRVNKQGVPLTGPM